MRKTKKYVVGYDGDGYTIESKPFAEDECGFSYPVTIEEAEEMRKTFRLLPDHKEGATIYLLVPVDNKGRVRK